MGGDALNDILPNYEVLDLIGRGGMGVVYKARQMSLDRIVAVKLLPREIIHDEIDFKQRFKQEAQTLAKLMHPGIAAVHDFGETGDGQLFFAMEFIDGQDLAKLIEQRGALPTEEALRVFRAVAEALAYAHSQGVVHRDIKPANVLIRTNGEVKVADFGLAKIVGPMQGSALTRTNVVMGSPDFVAPEAMKAAAAVDHRADIFSLGVMLYQMLTGELPRGMFKLPSRLVPGLDERFDAIICKAMEHDPADRYQSAEDMLAALDTLNTVPRKRPKVPWRIMAAAVVVLMVLAVTLMRSDEKGAASKPEDQSVTEAPWQPIFDKPEDFVGKRAALKDGWAVLADRPLTIGRDVRDGAVRATTRYLKSGVGSIAVRANVNGHLPVSAFISGEGSVIVLNFWPDYQSKESQRHQFKLPKPLMEGEEFTMELSARGDDFTVSVNGAQVGHVHRELPGVIRGTMGVIPAVKASVQFKDIAWREFQ